MAEFLSPMPGAARAVPAYVRMVHWASAAALRLSPWILVASIVLGFAVAWLGATIFWPVGVLPGIALAGVGFGGVLQWVRVIRPARTEMVVFVSTFRERSVNQAVRVSEVHRHELVTKLNSDPLLADILEIRKLPPLPPAAAANVLRRSAGWAIVLGETTAAGAHVRWQASVAYRLRAHSRYAGQSETGEPTLSFGDETWTPFARLFLPPDSSQPIEILAAADFPASHADGIALMLLAMRGTRAPDSQTLQAVNARIKKQWAQAPDPAKALTIASDADMAMATGGWPAGRQLLIAALKDPKSHHPMLLAYFAGHASIAASQGLESISTWMQATGLYLDRSPKDPAAAYLRSCALMGASRWRDAMDLLGTIADQPFGGPLAPPRIEVLAAYFQAADLSDDHDEMERAARLLFTAVTRRHLPWRRPPIDAIPVFAWLVDHNYDSLALPKMEARLTELGRSNANLSERRAEVRGALDGQ